jgi:hypothetical protein
MDKKTNKNTKPKRRSKRGSKNDVILTLGKISPERSRILVLIVLIIFMATGMFFAGMARRAYAVRAVTEPVLEKNAALKKQITQLVKGYPIARMMPYIMDKDPKVAAFLVSIAKKESNWGKRKPVLDGKDCYNYWGFRLSTDEMGSGGHTCFNSPHQAVEIVAARIAQLVNVEKIDSPKEMVVWKCGYGCLNADKSPSEKKWIKDVSLYYGKLSDYL